MQDSVNNIAHLAEAASGSGAKAALTIPASDSAEEVRAYAQFGLLRRSSVMWRRSVLSVVTEWRCLCRMRRWMPVLLYYGIRLVGAICSVDPLLPGAELSIIRAKRRK